MAAARKKPGPKPTGKGKPITVRLQPDQLAALDAWIASRSRPTSRPAAIRAMVAAALHLLAGQSRDVLQEGGAPSAAADTE